MAPEQATGDNVGHPADIYSLGITFYELLTGRVPFTQGDVAYHHRHTEPPDPRSLVDGLPDAMALLVLEMIRKDPAERCASVAEVERRLEQLIG
jgi:serine/threonine-protein kinase